MVAFDYYAMGWVRSATIYLLLFLLSRSYLDDGFLRHLLDRYSGFQVGSKVRGRQRVSYFYQITNRIYLARANDGFLRLDSSVDFAG